MERTMKAAVFKDIENIVIEEYPVPPCPEDGLLLKVYACGICGGDVRNYHNGLRDGIKNQIMGHEIAGKVEESLDTSGRFAVGDRVAVAPDISCGTCWYCKKGLVNLCLRHRMLGTHFPGGYAQYLALPSEVVRHGFVEPIPEDMSYDYAALAETASSVLACQNYNQVSLGDTIVIIGDGPVGCLHIEAARARGAGKIIMVGMDKLELAAKFSPDHLLDNHNPDRVVSEVRAITDGMGADIVISAVPSVRPQQQGLEMLRKRGRLVIFGGTPKNNQMTALDSNLIHYNELSVTGAFSYPATGLSDALKAIHSKKINAEKYVKAIPLEKVVEGMSMVASGESLKVVLKPW